MSTGDRQPAAGDIVVVKKLPPGLLKGLPKNDQMTIEAIVGKPVLLTEYDEHGRAELQFTDGAGVIHFIYVDPSFIGLAG